MLSLIRAGAATLAFLLILVVPSLSPPRVDAATLVVNSTADSGDAAPGAGGCDDGTGACTLRAAIQEANANSIIGGFAHTISFNIPGPGPHTIQPSSPLPAITEPVTIDGYTQPGSAANTAPISSGTNAVLMIELNGSNAGPNSDGLTLSAASLTATTVRGLAINGFAGGNGIRSAGGPLISIIGNFIGTDITGMSAIPNLGGVIGEPAALVGNGPTLGVEDSFRNVISGNMGAGVIGDLTDGGALVVNGNLIGVAADGSTPLGNGGNGVELDGGNGNVGDVGGRGGNVIAHNGGAGVADLSADGSLTVRQNSIDSNGGLGIEMTGPAPDPPILTSAELDGGVVTIEGAYSGGSNTDYTLEFFSNGVCDPSGNGEGRTFVGSTMVTTDGSGNASFNETFPSVASDERIYTATSTETGVATSVFSECRSLGDDADADGVTTLAELNCGSDPFDSSLRPERIDGPFAGVDDDGDTQVDEGLPSGTETSDCDGDGYTGMAESHVYSYGSQTTGDQKVCGEYDLSHPNPNANNKPSLRWPSDLNMSSDPPNSFEKVNIFDLASFAAPVRYLGTNIGTNPGDTRWDLSPGPGPLATDINILDLAALTAPASPTGAPSMFGGERAFLGPACTDL